jgi:hypothetical protein
LIPEGTLIPAGGGYFDPTGEGTLIQGYFHPRGDYFDPIGEGIPRIQGDRGYLGAKWLGIRMCGHKVQTCFLTLAPLALTSLGTPPSRSTLIFKLTHLKIFFLASYPGLWEVPMVDYSDVNGNPCNMIDGCAKPFTQQATFDLIHKNFLRHYKSNRAPFPMFVHADWFKNEPERMAGNLGGETRELGSMATLLRRGFWGDFN